MRAPDLLAIARRLRGVEHVLGTRAREDAVRAALAAIGAVVLREAERRAGVEEVRSGRIGVKSGSTGQD